MNINVQCILLFFLTLCCHQARLDPIPEIKHNEPTNVTERLRNLTFIFDDIGAEFQLFLKILPSAFEPLRKSKLRELCSYSGSTFKIISEKLKYVEDTMSFELPNSETVLDLLSSNITEISSEICGVDYFYYFYEEIMRSTFQGNLILQFTNSWLGLKNYNVSECDTEIVGSFKEGQNIANTLEDRVKKYTRMFSQLVQSHKAAMKTEACDKNRDLDTDIAAIGSMEIINKIFPEIITDDVGVLFFRPPVVKTDE